MQFNAVVETNIHARHLYDPVLLTADYTIERHLSAFERMARELAPYVDRCIFSFVEMYKKPETNMPEIILMNDEDKMRLAEGMGKIAAKYGLFLQTCGTNGDYSRFGIHYLTVTWAERLGTC